MPTISYAQNGEDMLLRRLFGDDRPGFYIDVGAGHPVYDSVTKHFSLRGWRGINVEPLPEMHELLCRDRPADVNLNVALGRHPATLPFFVVPACNGWSTLSAEAARKLADSGTEVVERTLAVRTLADVCAEHVRGEIDFLKIDVEEYEAEVIAGADWQRWRPRAVVVEATAQNSTTPNHAAWEPLLLAAGYLYATFDGLNRYYVRAEDRNLLPLLATPLNVFDDYRPIAYVERVRQLEEQRDAAHEQFTLIQRECRDAQTQLVQLRCSAEAQLRTLQAEAAQLSAHLEGLREENDRLAEALAVAHADLAHTGARLADAQGTLDRSWACLPYRVVRKARAKLLPPDAA